MFKRGETIEDDEKAPEGSAMARISIEKLNRYENQVSAYIVERSTGETVYKIKHKTIDPAVAAYYRAADGIRAYVGNEDLFLNGDITTNIELPFVRTLGIKSAYGRQ